MGVVVRRYIDFLILLKLSLLHLYYIALFCSSIPISLFILKMFFRSCLLFLCNIANVRCSKNIRNRSKIEITPTGRYNYIDKHIDCESRDFHMRVKSLEWTK